MFSRSISTSRTNRMLEDPYVKSVTLARRLPDTILVDIDERVPAAIVALAGSDSTLLVTRDGEAFKRVEVGDPPDLPVITGLRSELAETDREAFARCGETRARRRRRLPAVDARREDAAARSPLRAQEPDHVARRLDPSPHSFSAVRRIARSSSRPRASCSSSIIAGKNQTPSCSTTTVAPERVVARVR